VITWKLDVFDLFAAYKSQGQPDHPHIVLTLSLSDLVNLVLYIGDQPISLQSFHQLVLASEHHAQSNVWDFSSIIVP
jgi:hypothetical protein